MMTQVHYSAPFLPIHWDETNRCVWMEWKQFVKGKEFREGLDEGLALLRDKAATRWLADLRNLSALDVPDKEWSSLDWFPRAVAAGLRRMAIVLPGRIIPKMSVGDVMKKADLRDVEVEYFISLDDAREWLRKPIQPPSISHSEAEA